MAEERITTKTRGSVATEHLHRYAAVLPLCKDKVVLDIACGEGYGTELISKVAKRAIGMDKNEDVVDAARGKYLSVVDGFEDAFYEHFGGWLSYSTGLLTNIPKGDDSIDVVVCFESIEHIRQEDQDAAIKEFKRVLKPDGILVISTPDATHYPKGNPYHEHEMTSHEFIDLLERNFSHYRLYKQFHAIGSFIFRHLDMPTKKITGDFDGFKEGVMGHQYLIAVASDHDTHNWQAPEIEGSFFDGEYNHNNRNKWVRLFNKFKFLR